MRVVRFSTSHADALSAQSVLSSSGIAAHIADEAPGDGGGRGTAAIRVMVDNRLLERAQRVLRKWDAETATPHA